VTVASMVPVKVNGTKLVGILLWRGGKWYLRRKLPPTRTLAAAGLAGFSGLLLAAVLARRLHS
jgi:hypothetical protein